MKRIAFVLWITACGSTGLGTDVTADKACGDLAAARCNQMTACSTANARLVRDFGDAATCLAREKLACLNAVAAPSTANSPAGAEACSVAITGQPCTDFLDALTPQACVYFGTRAAGAPCAFAGQCQSNYCQIQKGTACGTCQMQPPVGTSCANLVGCGRNLFCDPVVMTCEAFAVSGAPCDRAAPCGAGLSCVGATMTAMGTCQPAAESVGAPCMPTQRTAPGCDIAKGLTCSMAMTCAAIAFGGDGASCGVQTDGSFVQCAGGGACYPLGARTGTCRAPAVDGAACDFMNGPPCLAPARCITAGGGATSGTCQVVTAAMCG
jgi:hypothetical protein